MPMCAWWERRGGDAVDQLGWRERELVHFYAAFVTRRFAVLFGAAVHQVALRFTKAGLGKGRPGLVAQPPFQVGRTGALGAVQICGATSLFVCPAQ